MDHKDFQKLVRALATSNDTFQLLRDEPEKLAGRFNLGEAELEALGRADGLIEILQAEDRQQQAREAQNNFRQWLPRLR